MHQALYYSWLLVLLAGCSSTPTSEKLIISAKEDLKVVEGIISDLDKELSNECDIALKSGLERATEQLKDADDKITSAISACATEKEVLEEQISNRNLTIILLILSIILITFIKIKKSI